MRICILGMGHIGLPTAIALARVGHAVVGVDTDPQVLESLKNRKTHFEEPELDEALQIVLDSGKLELQNSPLPSDVFMVAVPTPATPDKHADLSCVMAAGNAIASHLRPGNLVILESTVPPFTTDRVLTHILQGSGLKAGEDFYVAYSPERVLPGQILRELVENERIVGGINQRSAELARELYLTFVKGDILLTSTATAEMVKLMENTYRDVNIALANEFALMAQEVGLDVWEGIQLANRHPRVNIHTPGPGVGGHCIAVDPWFLLQMAPRGHSLIRSARQINDMMPARVLDMLEREVNSNSGPIVALGATYKGNVEDIRESPALEVVRKARELGYQMRIHDPHVRDVDGMGPLWPLEEAMAGARAIIVLADHREFRELDIPRISSLVKNKLLLDTRNCLEHATWREHGFKVVLLGQGSECSKS